MMLAIFTVTFVIFLATEVSEQTIMEYFTSATEVKKVQAYYAAEACLRLNLLRIKGYQQASKALGGMVPDTSMLDQIWSFPISWPLELPKDMSSFDSSTIKKTVAGSLLKEQFVSSITAEGGKIDINDLGSPSQGLRQRTKMQLLERFQSRILHGDDAFSERYQSFNFDELLNNISDWIDEDQISYNGGAENVRYTELRNEFLPPNRPFKTMEELHMVDGMTDEIYDMLSKQVTLYGVKGININQADRDVLISLFNTQTPEIAEQIVKEILKRRTNLELGGPFKNEKEFMGFLGGYIDPEKFNAENNRVPLFFGTELNFNINCVGVAGKMNREIEAVVYDANSVKTRLQDALMLDQKDQQGGGDTSQCAGLQGDELYACQCKGINEPDANKKCIEGKKAAATRPQDQSTNQPLLPGPPKIIFQRVK